MKGLTRFNPAVVLGLVLAMFTVAPFASATPVDVSAVVTGIEAALTPIGLIGVAVLLLLVGIKTYKWIRRAM